MFARVQTRLFRSLKFVDQRLGPFQALVGPNGSGKTALLDAISFLGDLARNHGEVLEAVQRRGADFHNLLWRGQGNAFQLAIEADIPGNVRALMAEDKQRFVRVRYEVEVGLEPATGEIGLDFETLWLKEAIPDLAVQRDLLPLPQNESTTLTSRSHKGQKAAVTKKPGGNDNYYTEGRESYTPSFKLGRGRSALANVPADAGSFPVSTWFRTLLEPEVRTLVLNPSVLCRPSPPGLGRRFRTDGANLPWLVADLRQNPERFQAWLAKLRPALADLKDIDTVELPDNRHRHLVLEYANGVRVPSWQVSHGTLRLLALTILAHLPDLRGTLLVEEPENGVHPRAIGAVVQSLSSIAGCQVLAATQSPLVLKNLTPAQVLCFARDATGATDIVAGDRHPALRDWKSGDADLGVLFASGGLG
jgi:predicted ATPase